MMIHTPSRDDDDRMRGPSIVHLQPNVIVRLMGIDAATAIVVPTPPPPPNPVASAVLQFQAQRRETSSTKRIPQPPYYYSSHSYYRGGNDDDDDAEYPGSTSSSRICLHKMMVLPRPRSRPSSRLRRRRRRRSQEEEELLQKMKRDLQAWQASRATTALRTTTSSRLSDSDGGGCRSSSSLVLQAIAQEDLRSQKMAARYGLGVAGLVSLNKNKKNGGVGVAQSEGDPSSEHEHEHEHEHADAAAEPPPPAMPDDDSVVVVVSPAPSSRYYPRAAAAAAPAAQEVQDLPSHGHTPIVLLKPATATTTTCSESDTTTTGGGVSTIGGGGQNEKTKATLLLLGLPKLHRDANMSVLLQEVKDRVQRELTVTAATVTGSELIKTPDLDWAIPPSLQHVISNKEDRGETKRRLFRRSDSFRAFRGDRKRNAGTTTVGAAAATTHHHASADAYYIRKSTGTAVSSSLPEKSCVEESSVTGASLSVLHDESFRSEECLTTTTHRDRDEASAASPRLLFRSFSAPESSGFSLSSSLSLGRLFSFSFSKQQQQREDEASEPAAADASVATMTSKSVVSAGGFSSFIRGSLHGFSSRRNLMMFRRKTHWSSSSNNNKKTPSLGGAGQIHPAAKMEMPICTTPPSHETFSLFKVAQASLSDLPPSPVSPLEVAAGHSSRHFFTDLHITLPPADHLSPKCLSEFEAHATTASEPSSSSFRTDITAVEAAAWSRDKAYITELLIAAGLYDDEGPSSANAARVDSMARPMPICDDVFEDVEDMYYYRGDYLVGIYGDGGTAAAATDHRMLFELANEALQRLVVLAESSSSSSLREWVVDSTGVARGKKLVDDVWQQVQALVRNPNPQQAASEMQTIDGMVAYEARRSVWAEPEVLFQDAYVVGRKIERAIFDQLIEDCFA